jgi:hypothetical protein
MKINAKPQLDSKTIKKYFNNQVFQTNENNKNFEDNVFKANEKSLYGSNSNKVNLEQNFENLKNINIEWKRLSDIFKNDETSLFEKDNDNFFNFSSLNKIFKESNFFNVISEMINYPDLLKCLLKGRITENKLGYYEICLFINGEWQVVTIDDYLPVIQIQNKFELIFSNPNKSNLFVVLLEKALSKVYGSYYKLYSNEISPSKIFHSLTGLPYEICDTKKLSKENIIEKVKSSLNRGEIIFSGNDSNKILKSYGLQGNKFHKIFDYRENEYKGEKVEMLILSKYEEDDWSGPWSEGDELWSIESEKLFKKHSDTESQFIYIDIDDFMLFFSSIIICQLSMSGFNSKSIDFDNDSFSKKNTCPYILNFEITSDKQTLNSISIIGEEALKSDSFILAIIAKKEGTNQLSFIDSKISLKNSDLHFSSLLNSGSYVIWIYTNTDENSKLKTLKIFSEHEVKIECPLKDSNFEILSNIIISSITQTNNKDIESSSQDIYLKQKSQFYNTKISYVYYYNKTTNKSFSIEVDSSDLENMKILNYPVESISNHTVISVPPNSKGVFIAIVKDPSQRFTFDISFNYSENKDFNDLENNYNKEENLPTNNHFEKEAINSTKPLEEENNHINNNSHENNTSFSPFENETESNIETLRLIEKNHPDVFQHILNLKKIAKEKNIKFDSSSLKWTINIEYKNGFFTGQLQELTNKKHGMGVYTWKTGEKYVGFWKDDMQSIFGTQYSVSGDILYEGEYQLAMKHGKGKLFLPNGDSYTGTFEEDSFQGLGSYTWKETGINWSGSFNKDKLFGTGKFSLPDGSCYEKEFTEEEN